MKWRGGMKATDTEGSEEVDIASGDGEVSGCKHGDHILFATIYSPVNG